jgi:hypothetical protein
LKKLLKGTFFLALLAPLGLYGYVRYDYANAAADLSAELDRAKRLGLPLTAEDMRPSPPVGEGENAAPLYREMQQEFDSVRFDWNGAELARAKRSAYTEEHADASMLEEALAKYERFLQLAVAASRKPRVDWNRAWDRAFWITFPEFAQLKGAAQWLTIRAAHQIRHGELDKGIQDLEAASRIAVHAGEEPVLIAGLVRVGIESHVLRCVELGITLNERRPQNLRKLAAFVEGMPKLRELDHYLRGEVYFGYDFASRFGVYFDEMRRQADEREFEDLGLGVESWRLMPPLIGTSLVQDAYAARALGYWNDMFEIRNQLRLDSRAMGFELDRMARRYETSSRPCDVMGAVMFPIFANAGSAFDRDRANRASHLGLIAALEYRARHGQLPKDLAQAGFAMQDPFGGEPLKLHVREDGIAVSSIGVDGKDGGGVLRQPATGLSNDDPMAMFPTWARSP